MSMIIGGPGGVVMSPSGMVVGGRGGVVMGSAGMMVGGPSGVVMSSGGTMVGGRRIEDMPTYGMRGGRSYSYVRIGDTTFITRDGVTTVRGGRGYYRGGTYRHFGDRYDGYRGDGYHGGGYYGRGGHGVDPYVDGGRVSHAAAAAAAPAVRDVPTWWRTSSRTASAAAGTAAVSRHGSVTRPSATAPASRPSATAAATRTASVAAHHDDDQSLQAAIMEVTANFLLPVRDP